MRTIQEDIFNFKKPDRDNVTAVRGQITAQEVLGRELFFGVLCLKKDGNFIPFELVSDRNLNYVQEYIDFRIESLKGYY